MRVAIVLSGRGWGAAPFADRDVEIWTVNDTYRLGLPRITRIFELHRQDDWYLNDAAMLSADIPTGKYLRPVDHAETLRRLGVPIYMQEARAEWPFSIRYPLETAIAAAGGTCLFDSSIAYALGLCLIERPRWIGMYGANMAGPEYGDQRPNAQWFLGLCVGMGIHLHIEPPSSLLSCSHLYGYEPVPASASLELRNELVRTLNAREQIVQSWIDGTARITDAARESVRAYDRAIASCHQRIAAAGLTVGGRGIVEPVMGGTR